MLKSKQIQYQFIKKTIVEMFSLFKIDFKIQAIKQSTRLSRRTKYNSDGRTIQTGPASFGSKACNLIPFRMPY